MKLIAAVDKYWGIGKDNKLLFNIPEDMKFFRKKTLGKTVVMGRKTLESLPNGKPLPNRKNIVLTRGEILHQDNLVVVHSFDELLQVVNLSNSDDVYLIGGAEIYNNLMRYCDELFITMVDRDGGADAYIVNLDEHPDYILSDKGEWKEYDGLRYRFTRYTRKIHM